MEAVLTRRRILCLAVLVAALVPATALAATVAGTYKGKTSQGKRVVVKVSHGAVVRGSMFSVAVHCHHGSLTASPRPRGRIRRGRLSSHGTFTDPAGQGVRVKGSFSLRFAVHGRVITGSFAEHDQVVGATGTVLDHCSVKITFRASR
jgi:hypothetical protein